VKDLIARHYPMNDESGSVYPLMQGRDAAVPSDLYRFLSSLKIPTSWIHEARAYAAKQSGLHLLQAAAWIDSGDVVQAQKLITESVAPQYILDHNLAPLERILSHVPEDGWSKVVKEYISAVHQDTRRKLKAVVDRANIASMFKKDVPGTPGTFNVFVKPGAPTRVTASKENERIVKLKELRLKIRGDDAMWKIMDERVHRAIQEAERKVCFQSEELTLFRRWKLEMLFKYPPTSQTSGFKELLDLAEIYSSRAIG
jgi:hypothetical protein